LPLSLKAISTDQRSVKTVKQFVYCHHECRRGCSPAADEATGMAARACGSSRLGFLAPASDADVPEPAQQVPCDKHQRCQPSTTAWTGHSGTNSDHLVVPIRYCEHAPLGAHVLLTESSAALGKPIVACCNHCKCPDDAEPDWPEHGMPNASLLLYIGILRQTLASVLAF
jgi:hypothetical protein